MIADKRSRIVYAVALALVVMMGLASRSSFAVYLPNWIAIYAGDILWALMVFIGLAFLFPRGSTLVLGLAALAISFGVEFGQLYQAAWVNGIRATRIGALVLGSGFKASDLLCYSVGISMGVVLEFLCHFCDRRASGS